MSEPGHLDAEGHARMVDISDKAVTWRRASARSFIRMSPEALDAVTQGSIPKGDPVALARVAGIMGAKKTPDLIPLCHPIAISSADVSVELGEGGIEIIATITSEGRTGVEMEALVAVTTAALTVYDMCKSIDRAMTIESVELLSKSGGRSGEWRRDG